MKRSPVRVGTSAQVHVIELDERSTLDLLALLSAIETCIAANDIRSVQIELDGQKYTLAAH
jgi:hypothetical protein